METFGYLLKEARKRADLTQKELAEKIGADHTYISRIERGVYDPPARDKVLAIADVLNITSKASRYYFLLTAGCAHLEDTEGLSAESQRDNAMRSNLPFAVGALHFPDRRQLEEEELIERIRRMLRDPSLSANQHAEYIRLLRSFVSWLEYQIEEEHEQRRDERK